MGLIYLDLRLLLDARRSGAEFKRIATLGRQNLSLHPREANALLSGEIRNRYRWNDYCEPYLQAILGAEEVVSIDVSDYEGATIVHDLNEPLDYAGPQFDLVIDGGCLEHVFNFPVAISNVMKLVRPGGRVLICNPANNLCGHGFYQFSPELMFRVLSEENGFKIEELLFSEHRFGSVEAAPPRRVVRVRDPKEAGGRALITSGKPLMQRVLAVKLSERNGIAARPQQSDYSVMWGQEKSELPVTSSLKGFLRRVLPLQVLTALAEHRAKFNLSNRRFFTPWPN